MAKQNRKEPTKKDILKIMHELNARVMSLQAFLDAMSTEFGKYLLFKGDSVEFKNFKDKYQEPQEKTDAWRNTSCTPRARNKTKGVSNDKVW